MKQSAGLLLYKKYNNTYHVLLVHPGGPFWKNKELGCWSIPKGEYQDDEQPLHAALREFKEETGHVPPGTGFTALGDTKLSSGKIIHAWACEYDIDVTTIQSNTFTMEWPPKSGQHQDFPEVDRAAWMTIEEAYIKIHPAQRIFIDALLSLLK